MTFLTTATLSWLNDGCCDVRYLDEWVDVPLSYTVGQPIDESWHRDQHEVLLGADPDGTLLERAAALLLRYQFYPEKLMGHVSDADLQKRPLQVGDRIAQRIHLLRLWGRGLPDVIGMTEVVSVVEEPQRRGFTYSTVATHAELGEWSVAVERREGQLYLQMSAISRPRPDEPRRNYRFMRWFQKRAHQLGIAHFRSIVLGNEISANKNPTFAGA